MKKVILFPVVFLMNYSVHYAQSSAKVDSLEQVVYQSDSTSSIRVDLLNKLAEYHLFQDSSGYLKYASEAVRLARKQGYLEGEIDAQCIAADRLRIAGDLERSLHQYDKIVQRADSINYSKGKSRGLSGKAIIHIYRDEWIKALDLYEEAIEICKSIDDVSKLASYYVNVSSTLNKLGRTKESLDYQFKALKIFEEKDDRKNLINSYLNIGVFYYYNDERERALYYYRKSLAINKPESLLTEKAICENNIALVYEEFDQLDSAEFYYLSSIKVGEKVKFKRLLGWSYNGMGLVEQKRRDFASAKIWFEKALSIRKAVGYGFALSKTYLALGDNYYYQSDYNNALINYKASTNVSTEAQDLDGYCKALGKLSQLYNSLGNFEKAIEYELKFIEMNDSLLNEGKIRKKAILSEEYLFRAEKDSISFAQQKERIVLNAETRQKKLYQMLLIVFLVFVFVTSALIFYSYSSVRKSNKRLATLNRNIKSKRDELKRLNELKARFFTVISHDLRSPINQLFSFGYIIKSYVQSKSDHGLDKLFKQFDYSYKNVLQLMDNVLNWGLIDAGNKKIELDTINLDEVVSKCVKLYEPFAQSKHIHLKVYEETTRNYIKGDQSSLYMLLRNLLSNAIKFTPAKGLISVNITRKSEQVVLAICDTGIGIPANKIKHLFDINQEKSSFGTEGEKGTGLGLKLAYEFAKMNNGIIEVKSEVGVGTVFTVRFHYQPIELSSMAS